MRKLKPLLLLTLFAASVLSAPEARADTVTLTGGTVNVSFFDTFFSGVTGDQGFSLNSIAPDGLSFRSDVCSSSNVDPCSPGQTVSGSGTFTGDIGPPQNVTLNGVEYPGVSLQGSTLRFVTGPFTLLNLPPTPPAQHVDYTITVPFTMTGTIVASGFDFGTGGSTGETFFTLDVAGSGMATILVGQTGSAVFFPGAKFVFQPQTVPTPEPATLLLLAGGLAGLAARVRRRKSRG